MPTIRDVAREAGVSISTVSRVIRNENNVLPETKKKIEEAIRKLDYHPNRLAQQFRTQQTRMILVIVPEIGNTFYEEILAGVEAVAYKNGYTVLLADSHGNEAIETTCYGMLSQKLVDGIITFSVGIPKPRLKQLASQYPIVIACRYFAEETVSNVTIDNIKATKDITSYILSLGHRRICYLAGPENVPLYQDRVSGYRQALDERGIGCDPAMIIHGSSSIQGGYEAMQGVLNSGCPRFDAVVSSGDVIAIGAIRALNEHGLRVPEDVAVTGFDDIAMSSLFNPPLTTVRQPKYLMGSRSTEKLLDLIAGKQPVQRREVLDYELVIRKSSGSYIGSWHS